MYKPFSDGNNVEKMVRQIEVFIEEITLNVNLLEWEGNIYPKSYGHWVKYVSTGSGRPREVYLYWDGKTEDEFQKCIIKNLLEKEGYFEELEDYFFDSYKRIEKFADCLFEKGSGFYKKLSNNELVGVFNRFYEVSKYPLLGYYVVYDCTSLLPKLVRKDIKEKFPALSEREIEKKLQTLSTAGIASVVKKEKLEFLKNLGKIQKIFKKTKNWSDEKIKSIIFDHWYKFGGCSFTHSGDYSTIDYFEKKFKKNIKLELQKEIDNIKSEEKADAEIIKKELNFFKKEKEVLKHIGWLRTMMDYRNREAEYWHNHFFHLWPFFEEISGRLNLVLNEFWYLSMGEIIDGLQGKINPKKIVREREKKGFTIKQIGNEIKVWTGVNKEDLHEKQVKKQSIFSGTAAFSGKNEGKVKVIFDPFSDIKKFKKGDILVAPMTTPEYIQLIKKAGAIITDEGGLLCHAAIVAREFKKPCIIGTKIATRVLKDGDLVEVDANKGVVKIIKRK